MSLISKSLLTVAILGLSVSCNRNTAPGNDRSADIAPPPPLAQPADVDEALREVARRGIEPSTMVAAEYMPLFASEPSCRFQLTNVGRPILVAEDRRAAIKANGKVVSLDATTAGPAGSIRMAAGDIEVLVEPLEEEGELTEAGASRLQANLVFSLQGGRTVGYRGYYICQDFGSQAVSSLEPLQAEDRPLPFQDAFGSDSAPVPPSTTQTSLEPWAGAALDTLYQRPSPSGPPAEALESPRAVWVESRGNPIQVLPGPAARSGQIPEHVKTVSAEESPFSNEVRELSAGSFRATAIDRTRYDSKQSQDEMAVHIQFSDHEGADWRIEQAALAPLSPNPVAEPWYGGVGIDLPFHGATGHGTAAVPEVQCQLCSWGCADIYKDDKRVASSAPLHIMLTSATRGEDFAYNCSDCKEQPVREVHVVVPPSAYLPAPGGFLHVMWTDAEWQEEEPERIVARARELEDEVPTIELSAVPYLAWDKHEIRVQVGRKYRLLVHNTDPSSFHQFSLHSRPEHAEHASHKAQHGEEAPAPMRHDKGGAAGGTGPLWQPDGSSGHGDGEPPGPESVFLPLPQGSTWATFVRFDETGEYSFMCPVGNHMRRGMMGTFSVQERVAAEHSER